MRMAKLISGIVALLAGIWLLWSTLIGTVLVAAFGQAGLGFVAVGFAAAVGLIVSGVLEIKARNAFRPKLELWAIGVMLALFIVALIVHKTYIDLWAQVGVPLLFAVIIVGVEYTRKLA